MYLVFNLPGDWFGGGSPRTFPGSALAVAAGSGQAEGDALIVTRPDAKNATIIALPTPQLRTLDYGLVTFDVDGIPDDAEVSMFWRNDLAPTKMYTRPLTVAGGRLQDAMVAGDSNWLGRIHTVGLILRTPLPQPVTVHRIVMKPATARALLIERWRDWLEREEWTGVSLSRIVGGRVGMKVPLTILAGLAGILALLTYWGLQRWRGWMFSPLTLAAIAVTAWLAVDLRWQWSLLSSAGSAIVTFAGKDLHSKRLASVDAELEQVAAELRPLIGTGSRVFLTAADPVIAGRLAYLLMPAQVYYDTAANALPSPERFRAGDLILVHRKPGVRYSPERKEFLWNERFRAKADILFLKQGTVLARVG